MNCQQPAACGYCIEAKKGKTSINQGENCPGPQRDRMVWWDGCIVIFSHKWIFQLIHKKKNKAVVQPAWSILHWTDTTHKSTPGIIAYITQVEGKSNRYRIERRIPSSDKSYPYVQYKIVRENNIKYRLDTKNLPWEEEGAGGGGAHYTCEDTGPPDVRCCWVLNYGWIEAWNEQM